MAIWIKNADTVDNTWVGQLIEDGTYYQIQDVELTSWMNNSTLITDIGSGKAVVAKDDSGNEDITDVSDGINYLKGINGPVDSDNAPLSRKKVAPTGWSYQMRSFEFETSKYKSFWEEEPDGTDPGFCAMSFFDDQDDELSYQQTGHESETEAQFQVRLDDDCVKTIATWVPNFDYEMIGGTMRQKTVPNDNLRMWVIAVPDLTPAQGGTKVFVNGVNMYYLEASESVVADGRASKKLTYDATYHTNKLQFILKHNTGYNHKLNMIVEFFKP